MGNIFIEPEFNSWPSLLKRPAFDSVSLETSVMAVLKEVKEKGDRAVFAYTEKYDGAILAELRVSDEERKEAGSLIDEDLKKAIAVAKSNIEAFHQEQRKCHVKVETAPGVFCWRKDIPVQKVGLYIPGGTAPLFSTLLMLGIPAVMAGCREIVVCSPPSPEGKVHPAILYVAGLLGITGIYKAGGAQAIAAMAYGTETIPQVYKIFGPGNQYVTCAKQLVNKEGLSIDMPAGPSEVAVYADTTANPAFVAADLLSQAEHGVDSQVLLVAENKQIVDTVLIELKNQLVRLPRRAIAEKAMKNSRMIVSANVDNAFSLLNEYAPEHLIIASDNAGYLAEKVINAGSVFLGHYSCESAGDYASGTNHTLPTNGYAKAYSGVSLDSFVKRVTFQQLDKEGISSIGKSVEAMAAVEGLEAHRKAMELRRNH